MSTRIVIVMKITKVLDGNEACATAAYLFSEVCGIYPITPASPMAEYTDKLLDISDKISLENDVVLSLQTSAKSEWLKNQKHSLYYRNILQEGKVYYG